MWTTISILLICLTVCYCINRMHITIEHVHPKSELPEPLPAKDLIKESTSGRDMQAFLNSLNSFMTGDTDDGRA